MNDLFDNPSFNDDNLKEYIYSDLKQIKQAVKKDIFQNASVDTALMELLDNDQTKVEKEKHFLAEMSHEEFAEWLMHTHDSLVNKLMGLSKQDFFEGDAYVDRYFSITFMNELNNLLSLYGLRVPTGVIKILEENRYNKLIMILSILNYTK